MPRAMTNMISSCAPRRGVGGLDWLDWCGCLNGVGASGGELLKLLILRSATLRRPGRQRIHA